MTKLGKKKFGFTHFDRSSRLQPVAPVQHANIMAKDAPEWQAPFTLVMLVVGFGFMAFDIVGGACRQ